jgi:hypothetical protein
VSPEHYPHQEMRSLYTVIKNVLFEDIVQSPLTILYLYILELLNHTFVCAGSGVHTTKDDCSHARRIE